MPAGRPDKGEQTVASHCCSGRWRELQRSTLIRGGSPSRLGKLLSAHLSIHAARLPSAGAGPRPASPPAPTPSPSELASSQYYCRRSIDGWKVQAEGKVDCCRACCVTASQRQPAVPGGRNQRGSSYEGAAITLPPLRHKLPNYLQGEHLVLAPSPSQHCLRAPPHKAFAAGTTFGCLV